MLIKMFNTKNNALFRQTITKANKRCLEKWLSLSVKFGNIEIDSENVYNNENEKGDIFAKLDKIVLPVLQKEKDTYDRN